jgi:hypothetical protein
MIALRTRLGRLLALTTVALATLPAAAGPADAAVLPTVTAMCNSGMAPAAIGFREFGPLEAASPSMLVYYRVWVYTHGVGWSTPIAAPGADANGWRQMARYDGRTVGPAWSLSTGGGRYHALYVQYASHNPYSGGWDYSEGWMAILNYDGWNVASESGVGWWCRS